MNAPPASYVRLSTDQFAERDRAEIMREVFGRTIMKLEFQPLPNVPLTMEKVLRSLPNLGLSLGANSAMNCFRTLPLIDSDDLILTVALSGGGTVFAHGKETQIGGGSATLACSADPHSFRIHSKSETITFRLGTNLITPMIDDFDSVLNNPIPANSDALRLLVHSAGVLRDADALGTPDVQSVLATHLYDLVALAIGATRDAAATASGRGVPTARLRAIKADIIRNLTDRNLSINTIARRHGITPRYVSMLFDGDATTFSEFVLMKRLNQAHRTLINPRFSDRTVSSVAFGAGFGDLSYFNRAFRRLYGATPSDVRAKAQRDEPN